MQIQQSQRISFVQPSSQPDKFDQLLFHVFTKKLGLTTLELINLALANRTSEKSTVSGSSLETIIAI